MRCLTAALLFLGLMGCVSTMGPKADQFLDRRAAPSSQHAERHALDIVKRADHAWQDAQQAHDADNPEEASEHLNRALIFLEAAIIETQRIELEQLASTMTTRSTRNKSQAMRDNAARYTIEQEIAQRLAAAIADTEVARSVALAESDESELSAASLEAARILHAKADLTCASATALSASASMLERARTLLRESRSVSSLSHAEQALRACELAMAQGRTLQDGASIEEAHSLLEAARAAGFEAQAMPNGVVLLLQDLTDGSSRESSARVRRVLARVARLALGFPKGELLIQPATGGGIDQTQGTRIRSILISEGVDRNRLRIQGAAHDPQPSATKIRFPAYGGLDL
ncbi:MAG: hypothetical protein H6714_01100 [Myxococcales bacterium]|nr:hypothetical protein [Myxococcales bacterium]